MKQDRESRWVRVLIIGKTIEQRKSLFSSRTHYLLAVEIMEAARPKTMTIDVSFDQYCKADVGKMMELRMYQTAAGSWVMSEAAAELLDAQKETE